MKLKRIISIVLAVVIALCLAVPAQVSASDILMSGSCGDNAEWIIFSDNILVITGSDAVDNYAATYPDTAPWSNYYYITNMGFMQKIVLSYGITEIGDYTFYMNSKNYRVNNITLPESLETIGAHAFENESKIQNIAIPQNVTRIGESAFAGCDSLQTVNLYCDPDSLDWNLANSGLPNTCVIHLKTIYDTEANRNKFAAYNPVFDLTYNPNSVYPNKKIFVSYENAHTDVLGGAHPYSIKLIDDKNRIWPITFGSRGFPTCVRYGGNYYMVVDNTGVLKRVTLDGNQRANGTAEDLNGLSLKVSNEYIGNYSVKIIYTVKNTGSESITFDMGSSGDIQIGTDDRAEIKTLSTTTEGEIGITMTSTKTDDQDSSGNRPTLGFIGKNVGGSSADAEYFYGAVTMDNNETATAVKADKFMPQRIFDTTSNSVTSGGYSEDQDSGLSFCWRSITLAPEEEKQYAVMFTVPYTKTAATNEETSEKIVEKVLSEVESNIGDHEEETYVTSNPVRTIFFNNEQQVGTGDTLAQDNGYTELQNFLLLGVQRKPELTERNCLRYVTVVNTNILRDADEYGYVIAKYPRDNSNPNLYQELRQYINQVECGKANTFSENIKGTSNQVSGKYGIYSEDTSYKYVTLGLNDVPDDTIFIVRFYVTKGGKTRYADYYTDLKNKTPQNKFHGCSADWNAVLAAAASQN